MNSSTLSSASAHATWKRAAPRFWPSRRICWTRRNRISPGPERVPGTVGPIASSSTIVHSSRVLSRSTRTRPATWRSDSYTNRRSCGRTATSGSRNRLNTPIGGPLTGSPSVRDPEPSVCAMRDSSPSAGRSVRRAARTLPTARACRASLPSRAIRLASSGQARAAGRVVTPAGTLAGVVVLGGHRRDEPMEARLPGQLRVERRGEDIPLPDRDDPAVVERREDVHIRADTLDDRGADEHATNGLVAHDRHRELALE